VVSFTPLPLYSQGKAPDTHLIGGWVGPRAGLDVLVRRKIPSPCWDWNPPIIRPVAQRCTAELSRLLVPTLSNMNPVHNFPSYFSKMTITTIIIH
jgi:hypothetical protein